MSQIILPAHVARLDVDVQKDFGNNGRLAVADGNAIVPVINNLNEIFYAARCII